jgi:hypothetical protein
MAWSFLLKLAKFAVVTARSWRLEMAMGKDHLKSGLRFNQKKEKDMDGI